MGRGRVLNLMAGVFKRGLCEDTERKMPCEDEERNESDVAMSQGMSRAVAHRQKL